MPRHSRSHPNFFIRLLLKWAKVRYVPDNQRHSHTRHHSNTRTDHSQAGTQSNFVPEASPANSEPGNSNHHTHHRRRKRSRRSKSGIRRVFRKFTGFFSWKSSSGNGLTINKLWTGFKNRIGIKPKRKPLPETLFYKTTGDGSYKIIKATPITGTGLEEAALTRPLENINHSRRKHLHRKRKFSLRRLFRNAIAFISGNKSKHTHHTSRRQKTRTAIPTGAADANTTPPLPGTK